MEKPTCETCIYYRERDGGYIQYDQCRRRAPTSIPNWQKEPPLRGFWPQVMTDDYCGEHKEDNQ